MSSNPIQDAIDEQLKSSFPQPVTDIIDRPVGELERPPRRKTETILIEMIDKLKRMSIVKPKK